MLRDARNYIMLINMATLVPILINSNYAGSCVTYKVLKQKVFEHLNLHSCNFSEIYFNNRLHQLSRNEEITALRVCISGEDIDRMIHEQSLQNLKKVEAMNQNYQNKNILAVIMLQLAPLIVIWSSDVYKKRKDIKC